MATSSTAKANGSQKPADMEALNAQISELRKDLSDLVGIVGQMGSNAKDSAADTVADRINSLASKAENAKTEAELRALLLKEKTEDTVREQPATALLIATGIGFLVGTFMSRR
ncbi:DUF883 family protein [Marivita hallyeonensis]|uniref:Membrane-anchored ribosome-binding protein, inhibits growth in stationary phase, ElaB/YqjD/DUF883 family n=1 Tax=Marivita hallyeonensis TaxID=996342 RepID=A0A1M5QZX3_9RHOB|nr:DUF883 family protein [Marivita hallyeonensis]SHH19675.1 Membrane-anchored ribosome-binding protein, inhibits growth in stationary phase, ElaB/YqjD/DUF883 family [Marivita hallyeonensis]